MFIGEFNSKDLNTMLLGICVNSDISKISDATKDILRKELVTELPTKLIHSYTLKEFSEICELFKEKSKSFFLREIIPNNFGVGLVRKVGYKNTSLRELLKEINKKFKYYALVESNDGEKLIITFNPEMKDLKNSNINLGDGIKVRCKVLQVGTSGNKIEREFPIMEQEKNAKGDLLVYEIKMSELIGEMKLDA